MANGACDAALASAEAALSGLEAFKVTADAIGVAVAEKNIPVVIGLLVPAWVQAQRISVNAANALNSALSCIATTVSGASTLISNALAASGYTAPTDPLSLTNWFFNVFGTGGPSVAAATFQLPPGSEACRNVSKGTGVCCAALSKGMVPGRDIIAYTTCSGKQICVKCYTTTSTSKHHAGRHIWQLRRAAGCSATQCPGLAQAPLAPAPA